MIRPIDIRLNAAHPELPLAEAVTFTGSPSTVLIRGVPPNCGRWAITAVSVAATFPDGSTTTRAAVQSANGVWVATLPATARSGRTANGLRVLADGIDENGEAVTGYILGVADFAVASLGVTPAPEPGETSWQMLYFDAVPGTLRKGDVAKIDGVLKLYNGTAWEPFAGDIPAPSTATPAMDGTGSAGSSAAYARGDHVHPTDTSRVPTSRKVNGKALTSDVELDAEDVGALPSTTDGSNEYVSADVHFTGGGGDITLPLGGTGTLTYLPSNESTTQNNLVAWKEGGGLADSGKKPSDFQSALSQSQLDNIAAVPNKANDADVVHKTGDETIGGNKTFTGANTVIPFISAGQGSIQIGISGRISQATAAGLLDDTYVPNYGEVKSIIPYTLVTKTISNNAVTLDDRAINAVAVSSSLASLTVNFPTATSGKARDFGLRLTVASGITTAPQIVLPQGVTCENADGEAPEIGADGASTILYFTETASCVFLVKGEVLQTITA